jgi:hypothetical protein
MYSVRKSATTGRSAGVELRALVDTKMPLATAKALTFTAQAAQREIVRNIGQVFEGGATRYSLNATRIETATPEKLSARVAVKDRTTNGGTLPEDYLLPQVQGQRRKEKRFERALRFGGLLSSGERAVLGRSAPAGLVTAQGNLKVSEVKRILAIARPGAAGRPAKGRRTKREYFAITRQSGAPATATPGIYQRGADGGIVPVLVFVRKQPSYRPRLPFDDIARRVAEREFPATFARLLRAATNR